MIQSPVTIVILAAGLGTRMKSKRAKVLHKAGGRTLVEHVARTALEIAEPDRVFVVVGHQGDEVRATLRPLGVGFVEQKEQKGTGHALMECRDALKDLGGRLVVLYGDCPLISAATLRRLIETHAASQAAATVITTVLDDPSGYGRVIHDASRNVLEIVEQKVATEEQLSIREINSGIYCLESVPFWEQLDRIRPNSRSGEYYLTDIVELLNQSARRVRSMRIHDPGEVLGINTRVELAQLDRLFRERTVRDLMLSGVTIEKPETVTVDAGVKIGPDTILGPFSQLLGNTVVGSDCQIGACSIVENSELGERVHVGPFTMIAASRVGDDARIGPYARLRMGNLIEAGVHIGNFVELKKTHMGTGAKANHLAYLGDSEVGARANIGAGAITCNYDGVAKHQTTIGAGAFVGSNSTLVAPVEIGEQAYLAAGSVITESVPSGSLALGRARQVNKEGWVRKKKSR